MINFIQSLYSNSLIVVLLTTSIKIFLYSLALLYMLMNIYIRDHSLMDHIEEAFNKYGIIILKMFCLVLFLLVITHLEHAIYQSSTLLIMSKVSRFNLLKQMLSFIRKHLLALSLLVISSLFILSLYYFSLEIASETSQSITWFIIPIKNLFKDRLAELKETIDEYKILKPAKATKEELGEWLSEELNGKSLLLTLVSSHIPLSLRLVFGIVWIFIISWLGPYAMIDYLSQDQSIGWFILPNLFTRVKRFIKKEKVVESSIDSISQISSNKENISLENISPKPLQTEDSISNQQSLHDGWLSFMKNLYPDKTETEINDIALKDDKSFKSVDLSDVEERKQLLGTVKSSVGNWLNDVKSDYIETTSTINHYNFGSNDDVSLNDSNELIPSDRDDRRVEVTPSNEIKSEWFDFSSEEGGLLIFSSLLTFKKNLKTKFKDKLNKIKSFIIDKIKLWIRGIILSFLCRWVFAYYLSFISPWFALFALIDWSIFIPSSFIMSVGTFTLSKESNSSMKTSEDLPRKLVKPYKSSVNTLPIIEEKRFDKALPQLPLDRFKKPEDIIKQHYNSLASREMSAMFRDARDLEASVNPDYDSPIEHDLRFETLRKAGFTRKQIYWL